MLRQGVNLGMRNCGSNREVTKKVLPVDGGIQFGNPSTNIVPSFKTFMKIYSQKGGVAQCSAPLMQASFSERRKKDMM